DNRLLKNPQSDEHAEAQGALPEVKIAEAPGEQVEYRGDPRAFGNEGVSTGGHLAGGEVRVEKGKGVEKDSDASQNAPKEIDASAGGELRSKQNRGGSREKKKREDPHGPGLFAAVKLPEAGQHERTEKSNCRVTRDRLRGKAGIG